jgi:hypothetical protein
VIYEPSINFEAMYDVLETASVEHKDLMKKWRIYNRECWLRAIDIEIRIRCRSGVTSQEKTRFFKTWKDMVSQDNFAAFLLLDVSKVPIVYDEDISKRRNIIDNSADYQVDLQTGSDVDLEFGGVGVLSIGTFTLPSSVT